MRSNIIKVLFLSFFINGFTQDINLFFTKADAFFKENVLDGKVAYTKIAANKESLIDVLKIAESVTISKSEILSYQAFWINAYNLSVIKGVVDEYPISSPLDKNGFFDKITYKLSGKMLTLNAIENEVLRAQFNDPRIHFVLVCGAIGCPPLLNHAYLPNLLNAQLEQQTKRAINGAFLKIDDKKKKVEVSQIMEWYKSDFTMNGTTEIDFINKYRSQKIDSSFKISYFPYNWNLNKQ